MSAVGRLAAFAAVLLVIFVAGYGIGAVVGPEPTPDEGPGPATTAVPADHQGHEGHGSTP
jgi:hypothetical protein